MRALIKLAGVTLGKKKTSRKTTTREPKVKKPKLTKVCLDNDFILT
jgi:ATP-dependent Clp protease adapter protein ClpS